MPKRDKDDIITQTVERKTRLTEQEDGAIVAYDSLTESDKMLFPAPGKPMKRGKRLPDAPFYAWVIQEDGSKKLTPIQSAADIPNSKLAKFPYSDVVADKIAMLVAEGASISQIAQLQGFPTYSIIKNWEATMPAFKELIQQARKDRAEVYNDKIHAVAEKATEWNSKASKIKLEAYKHLAATGDPEQFGSRTKIVGDKDQPVAFFVDTGIPRPPLPMKEEDDGE